MNHDKKRQFIGTDKSNQEHSMFPICLSTTIFHQKSTEFWWEQNKMERKKSLKSQFFSVFKQSIDQFFG